LGEVRGIKLFGAGQRRTGNFMASEHIILVTDPVCIPAFNMNFGFPHHLITALLLPLRTAIVDPDVFIKIRFLGDVTGAVFKTEQ
jgi:hypothetical protein